MTKDHVTPFKRKTTTRLKTLWKDSQHLWNLLKVWDGPRHNFHQRNRKWYETVSGRHQRSEHSKNTEHFQQDLSFYYKWSTRRNIEKKRKLKPVFSRYWFNRFTTGAEKEALFVTAKEAKEARQKIQSTKAWHNDRVQYIKWWNYGALLPSLRHLFLIEYKPVMLEEAQKPAVVNILVRVNLYCIQTSTLKSYWYWALSLHIYYFSGAFSPNILQPNIFYSCLKC